VLIQMATGSGKDLHGHQRNLPPHQVRGRAAGALPGGPGKPGDQTLQEFQQYVSPYNNLSSEEYNRPAPSSNASTPSARSGICTIQRLFSMLKGRELPEDLEEESAGSWLDSHEPEPSSTTPGSRSRPSTSSRRWPPSIYNLWGTGARVLRRLPGGLTATPSKQTFGFSTRTS